MAVYVKLPNGIIQRTNDDGTKSFIPSDEGNRDYQEFRAKTMPEAASKKSESKPKPKAKPPKKAKKK